MTIALIHHDGSPDDQEVGGERGAKFSICLSVACLPPMSDTLQYTPLSNDSVTSCVIYFILKKKHKEGGTYLGSQFEGTVNHGGEIMMTGIQKGT